MSTPPPPPPGAAPPPPPGAVPPPPGAQPAPPGAIPPVASLGMRRSKGLVILLSIVTLGIWTVVWSYQNGDEIKRWSGRGVGGVGYLFITLFIAPVTMFMLANEVEELYRREGRPPRITTIWGLWFLLPIIGNIVWYIRIQNAINEYWSIHGQTNSPGV